MSIRIINIIRRKMQETQWSVRALLNHQPTEPMTFELKALNIGDRLNGNLILVRYAQSLTCASTCVQSICSINQIGRAHV